MKRILAISTLAVVACFGFNSAASAQTATSSHSGTVTATCSVTSDPAATFTAATQTINGVAFPVSLTSTGKFTTLCNTLSSGIQVEQNAAPTVPTNQPAPTVTYDLSASGGAYVGNSILGTDIAIGTPKTGAIGHGFSATPSDLGVGVKVAAQAGKILENGTYTVVLKATLTP